MTKQQIKKAAVDFMNDLRYRADRKLNIVSEHKNHL